MKTVVVIAVFGLLSLAQPSLPPPFPRPGIEKAFENDYMVVWKGLLGLKGMPTVMHHHERDLVGVFLDPGQVRTMLQDGTMREGSPFVRGAVAFQARGVTHVEEVLVDGTRAVGVEPKPGSPPRRGGATAIPPDDGRVVVDNEYVTVREYVWTAGTSVRQALQGPRTVLVGLESGEISESSQGGSAAPVRVVFGEVSLAPAERMRVTTASRGTPRVISVTVK